jgi:SnoaL-like protein
VYRGADAALDYMRHFVSSFSEISYRPVEIKQHGERVLAKMQISGRGAGSDVPVEITGWWGFVFHDGLLVRGYGYVDRDRALEVLGLTEEDLAPSDD